MGGARSLWVAPVLAVAWFVCAASPASAYTVLVPDAAGNSHTVASLDTTTNVPGASVMAGLSLLGAAISPDALTGYVVAPGSDDLTPIDLPGSSPEAGTPVGLTGSPPPANTRSPQNIAISPDGRKAYISDQGNNEVLDVNLTGATPTLVSTIAVGSDPVGIAFSPDGSRAYVADFSDGTVTPITVATDTPGTPITGVGTHPTQIAITPDGSRAYVTDNGADKVYPIALPAGIAGSPITVGTGPIGIAITADGTTAYTADFGPAGNGSGTGDTVTPIDLATNTPKPAITVGGGPWAVAVTPDGKTVYATNSNDGTVTPIDTATRLAGSPIALGVTGRSIAITPDQAPVASFSASGSLPGSPVAFDASASTVRYGAISSYAWDFGDGASETTTTPTTTHAYASAGSYTATVTETDSAGTSITGTVYTGQTASRVGSPSARAARSVLITTGLAPAVSLSAPALDFGSVPLTARSASQTLTVRNTGSAPLHLGRTVIAGANAGDFSSGTDLCSGQTVPAGGACSIGVSFTPIAAGGRSAALSLAGDATGSPYTVSLTGVGLNFGSVTGHVTDASTTPATPLAGALVSICPRGPTGIELGGAQCRYTSTDASGSYTLANLDPGPAAMEVHPVSAALSSGSAQLTVVVGPPTVQDFALDRTRPLPNNITFTTASGSQTGGSSILYWDAPFQITLPPLVAAPAHATPGSVLVTIVQVALSSGTTPVQGSTLTYLTGYDRAGNAIGGRAIARALPGAPAGGFDFTLGGVAVPAGGAGAGSSALGSATDLVAQSSGLHRQAHGTVSLTIRSVRVAGLPPAAGARGAADRHLASAAAAGDPDSAACASARHNLLVLYLNFPFINGHPLANDDASLWGPDPAIDAALAAVDAACGPEPAPTPPSPPCSSSYPCDPANIFCEQIGSCDKPVDPSGFVTTLAGVPLEHARVVLQRSDTATGPFAALPNGSPEMSATNRRNPDATDLNGHFGWDVFPGFYRVRASRRGCHGTALSRARPVPPPVTDLRLTLKCPGLRRAATRTRILSVRRRGSDTVVVIQEQPGRRAGSHRGLIGVVTLSIGRRQRGFAFITPRSGRVTIVIPGHLRHGTRLVARYAGNARFAPSSATERG